MTEPSERIEAILSFVGDHPESYASRTIRRAIIGADQQLTEKGAVLRFQERLSSLDTETLNGYYDLVR
jgi:hypothetical protein